MDPIFSRSINVLLTYRFASRWIASVLRRKEAELQWVQRPSVWCPLKDKVQVPTWVLAGFQSQRMCSSPNLSCAVSEWVGIHDETVFSTEHFALTHRGCFYLIFFFFISSVTQFLAYSELFAKRMECFSPRKKIIVMINQLMMFWKANIQKLSPGTWKSFYPQSHSPHRWFQIHINTETSFCKGE